jgi:hypothetical protein
MTRFRSYISRHGVAAAWTVLVLVGLGWLLLYKLGSLTGGLSAGEFRTATAPVGWHGIYRQPLYLPLELARSVVFWLSPGHGQTLTRLPNAFFGGLAILSFAWLIRLWHSRRTAVLASLLFATSAWVLHVSRLASFDVMYLWATPTLLLIHSLFQKYAKNPLVWYGSLLVLGFMLYIPGLVWLVALEIFLDRGKFLDAWKRFGLWWQRVLYIVVGLAWLPLLVIGLRRPGNFLSWLGLPSRLVGPSHLLKQFVGVPVHLFIRGPQYPTLWLARSPILDIFTLAGCLIGIYFYAAHWRAARSRLLGLFSVIGVVLVGLGGPVGLSLLVPLLYVGVATGIAYLLHEWLQVFPNNPLARGLGLSLVIVVVGLSCVYNLRAYFIAWPHNQATSAIFHYRR